MHEYLVRLEDQQRAVLEMITGKKQELIDKYSLTGVTQVCKCHKVAIDKKVRLNYYGCNDIPLMLKVLM